MKLKAFDIDDILYNAKNYNNKIMVNEVKEKLKSYVLYFIKDDSVGICLEDQKENIIDILREYGEVNIESNFIDVNKFLCTGDYGWDNIILGNYELDAEEVWSEFGKLLKKHEQNLLNSGEKFEEEWYKLQKLAIKNIFEEIKKDIIKEIECAEKDLNERIGMYR